MRTSFVLAQGVDVNEPCAGRQGLKGDQLPHQAFAQAGKESILGRRHGLEVLQHAA